jgi:hypothetical protein
MGISVGGEATGRYGSRDEEQVCSRRTSLSSSSSRAERGVFENEKNDGKYASANGNTKIEAIRPPPTIPSVCFRLPSPPPIFYDSTTPFSGFFLFNLLDYVAINKNPMVVWV